MVTLAGASSATNEATACAQGGLCWSLLFALAGHDPRRVVSYAVGEENGEWLRPYQLGVPTIPSHGSPALSVIPEEISCWSASACTVAGWAVRLSKGYAGGPFVQTETNGRWHRPAFDIGIGTPFHVVLAHPGTFACTPDGACLLGGFAGSNPREIGAVLQEVAGRWGAPVRGIGAAAPYLHSVVYKVSCHTPALCVATGASELPDHHEAFFAQIELGGHWRRPLFVEAGEDWGQTAAFPTAAACPTATSCDVLSETVTLNHRYLSIEARFNGMKWHYSIVSLGSRHGQTELTGMSCAGSSCWVAGTVYDEDGALGEGVVIPFTVK